MRQAERERERGELEFVLIYCCYSSSQHCTARVQFRGFLPLCVCRSWSAHSTCLSLRLEKIGRVTADILPFLCPAEAQLQSQHTCMRNPPRTPLKQLERLLRRIWGGGGNGTICTRIAVKTHRPCVCVRSIIIVVVFVASKSREERFHASERARGPNQIRTYTSIYL